jgi:release factor glutamine methyltransferase
VTSPAGESELMAELLSRWAPLPDKPEETPEFTLRALAERAAGDNVLLRDLVRRRMDGEPLSYLTGKQTFMGIEMLASPEALIPRKETEIVCRGALTKLSAVGPSGTPVSIIDVCCGAGNLGLALAARMASATVRGADISAEAVGLANRNATYLGLADRVRFQTGDLFAPFDSPDDLGLSDLIICNPPYISSARVDQMPREISAFEPRAAFDGGPFGVKILTRLVREARKFLKPDGWLAFEVGLGQGNSMRKILENSPAYRDVEALPDAGGETRALLARAAAASV